MAKQKYEREISEILDRLDRQGQAPSAGRPPRPRWSFDPGQWVRRNVRLPGGGQLRWGNGLWLLLSLGLPLLGVLLQNVRPVGSLLVLIGVLIFLSPLVLGWASLLRPRQRTIWRGRVIDFPQRGGSSAWRWRYQLWSWRQRWERWRRR